MYKVAAQNKIDTNESFLKFFRTKGNAPVHVLFVFFFVVYMYLFLSEYMYMYVHFWQIHSKAGGIEILISW